ncbi:MAG: ATP-binding protein [Anaerolineae bacterium]
MGQLCIRTFGGLRLERDGQPLPLFPTQKVRALFAYLVTFRNRPHPRAVLAGLFWPDMPEERARHNLSDALWRLRRVVGNDVILADEETLAFNTAVDYWLDLDEFVRLRELGRGGGAEVIEQCTLCVEHYQGEFLEGFYDDWALRERERLHLEYLQVLERMLIWYRDRGTLKRALKYGLRLTTADPLRDAAQRQVMFLYYRLGWWHAALQQFESYRRNLREELDTEPLPETIRLADEIRQQAAPDRSPFDDFGRVPLVGRKAERANLLASLDRASAGQGGVFLIEGEPGVGKTRLVEEVARSADWRGFQVLWGACREAPYAPLIEALNGGLTPLRADQLTQLVEPPLLSALSSLLPLLAEQVNPSSIPSLDPVAEKERLHHALANCLVALGRIAPHLMILEDWQWMDPATLETLSLLASHLLDSRVLLLGTARSGPLRDRTDVWDQVLSLDRSGALEHVSLTCLNRAETGDLLCRLLDCSLPQLDLVERIYATTQGNPLFVIEWLKALVEDGQLRRDSAGIWLPLGDEPWQPPAAVQRVIATRLDRLSADERRLLEAAAVLDEPLDFDLWSRTTGEGNEVLLAGSDELLRQQFIAEAEAGYRFTHHLIRQEVYERIRAEDRQLWHLRAGLALEKIRPDELESLARHFERAGDEVRAFDYHLQAGDRARALYAHRSAQHHYGRAIALATSLDEPQVDGRVAATLCRRAELRIMSGDFSAAEADYRKALGALDNSETDRVCQGDILRGLGWLRGRYQGELDEGLTFLEQAQKLYQDAGETHGLIQALVHRGHLLAEQCHWSQAISLYDEAQVLVRQVDDRSGLARVLLGRGVCHLFLSKPFEAEVDFEAAADLYSELGDRWGESQCRANLGQARLHLLDLPGAIAAFEQAWGINEEIGAETAQPFVLTGLAYALLAGGDLAGARQVVQEGIARQKPLGEASANMAFLLANLVRVQINTGELEAALETARKTVDVARQIQAPTAAWGLRRLAYLYRLLGQLDRAAALAEEALDLAREMNYDLGLALARQSLGEIALTQGELVTAREHLGFAMHLARQSGGWYEIGGARLAMAEYWLAAGRPARALALARRTERKSHAGGAVLLRLQALISMGRARLALDDPERARPLLTEVLTRAEACGLPLLVWQAAAALAQAHPDGVREHLARAWDAIEQLAACVTDGALRRSFLATPEVRCVAEQLEHLRRTLGHRQCVLLSNAGGQSVPVTWLADAGQADKDLLAREGKVALRRARLQRLLEAVRDQGAHPTQAEIAHILGVSDRTIRSDLAALRRVGKIKDEE